MATLIEKVRVTRKGFDHDFKSVGLDAHVHVNKETGVAKIKFIQAENMAAALEAVVGAIQIDATTWGLPLHMVLDTSHYPDLLKDMAPRFGFTVSEGRRSTLKISRDISAR